VKWHLAHTTWFFETFVLSEFIAQYKPFNPDFRWLFNSYYNSLGEMPEKRLRSSFSRPPLRDIFEYRKHVDRSVRKLLETAPHDEALKLIVLGVEHEQQHQELIVTDIKHALFKNPLHPAFVERIFGREEQGTKDLEWRLLRCSLIDIGVARKELALDAFAFDKYSLRLFSSPTGW
jgi:hypothetical protein